MGVRYVDTNVPWSNFTKLNNNFTTTMLNECLLYIQKLDSTNKYKFVFLINPTNYSFTFTIYPPGIFYKFNYVSNKKNIQLIDSNNNLFLEIEENTASNDQLATNISISQNAITLTNANFD